MSYEMIVRAFMNNGIISPRINPQLFTAAKKAPVRIAGPEGDSTPQLIRIRGFSGCFP
jgi:hypothetical protein